MLRKRALEEYQLDQKRAKVEAEEKRIEAMDEDEKATIRARAEEGRQEAWTKRLEQAVVKRNLDVAMKEEAQRSKVFERWLQTMYPALLAASCIETCQGLSPGAKKNF